MPQPLDNPSRLPPTAPTVAPGILCARGIVKGYGRGAARVPVLHGVDLEVRAGEFLAVMGESGCGKSTLLHVLGLMSRPDEGAVLVRGQDVAAVGEAGRIRMRRTELGFVFQRFNLLGVLSAYDNIALSLRVRGMPPDRPRIEHLLDRMGVAHLAARKAGRMSIGQQQRVAVARALVHRPAILLADEPTGNLDSTSAEALLDLLRQANQQDGQTILMITHSPHAAAFAGRTLTMKDGRIS